MEEELVSSFFLIFFSKEKESLSRRLLLFSLNSFLKSFYSSSPRRESIFLVSLLSRSLELGYFLRRSSSLPPLMDKPRELACSLKVSRYTSSLSTVEVLLRSSITYFSTLFLMNGLLMTSTMVGLFCGFTDNIDTIRSRSCFEYVGVIEG